MDLFHVAAAARVSARVLGVRSLAANAFIERADEILVEHQRLTDSDEYLSPFQSPAGFLKRECYALILEYRVEGKYTIIQRLSRSDMQASPQPTYQDNPFFWGLLAIDPHLTAIGRKNNRFYADQLKYAHQHGVGPEHLVGFLYQSGSESSLRRKVRLNLQDDEFNVIRNRFKNRRPLGLHG